MVGRFVRYFIHSLLPEKVQRALWWMSLALIAAVVMWAVLRRREPFKPSPQSSPVAPGGKLGDFVLTWYTFQDNTPCNSSASASGRKLVPYVSVAVPFRFLAEKGQGGQLKYGDQLFLKFLEGRTMPNGSKHTGWVQLDDFCGDHGNDDYCYQKVDGKSFPNVDLYIGDYTKSGMGCTGGPAGDGQEETEVLLGPAPPGMLRTDYGGAEKGTAKCGKCDEAKKQQAKCNWHYTPTYESWWGSVCTDPKFSNV